MTKDLNYLVIGAGGTGGSIAAYMTKAGKQVTLIVRGEHGNAIIEHGITVIRPNDTFSVNLSAVKEQEYQDKADVIFVCVKGYSLPDVYTLIQRSSHKDTIVIPILNIYGTGEKMSKQLSGIRVLNGCIYIAAAIEDIGVIKLSGEIFRIVYGTLDGEIESEILTKIAEDLQDSGIEPVLSGNIRRDTFRKFSFVSPMAAVGAYFDKPAGAFQKESEVRNMFTACIEEINNLANAMEIPFGTDIVSDNLKIMDALEEECTASMQKDLKKKSQSEIDGLLFEVLQIGKRYGVEVPVYTEIARKFDNMKFEIAVEDDINEIMSLYRGMIGTDGCTWSEDYPSPELLKKDIENQNEFCIRNNIGDIIAAIVIDEDDEVAKLPLWNPNYKRVGELARLAVREDYQNRGIAVKLIRETALEIKKRGYDSIHFLVSKTNPRALASYRKINLNIAGEIQLFGVNWLCYEAFIDEIL